MANIVTLTGRMEVRPEKEKEFTVIVKELMIELRKQDGCLNCRFYKDIEMVHTYCLIGMWNTPADAKSSFQSDEFALLLTAFDLLKNSPEVSYMRVLYPDGLKIIRIFRNYYERALEELEKD